MGSGSGEVGSESRKAKGLTEKQRGLVIAAIVLALFWAIGVGSAASTGSKSMIIFAAIPPVGIIMGIGQVVLALFSF